MGVKFTRGVLLPAVVALLCATSTTMAQSQTAQSPTNGQVAKATDNTNSSAKSADAAPLFSEYHGVKIGMPVKDVRGAVDRFLKSKADTQDFLVLSDNETAQIFYDSAGKVTAISIDYLAKNPNAPAAKDVLGIDIDPKPDGSMYGLKRYPASGYWVSYNRTSGDNPTITITMQSM